LLREKRGLSMKELSLRAGLNQSTMQKLLSTTTSPSIATFMAIARELGVSPAFLLTGDEAFKVEVPVVGIVSAGEFWDPSSDAAPRSIEFDIGDGTPIAIEVRGDSMSPVYRSGDVLICERRTTKHADNLIGRDCVIKTVDGIGYIKILRRGSRPGVYSLKSYNPISPDIDDVSIDWAAPISWVKRV